jgi:hypothetical protein
MRPHLPNALIGIAPLRFQMREQCTSEIQRRPGLLEAAYSRVIEGVRHLTEDIELKLVGGCVAGAHGLRALVAAEPRKLALGQPPLARYPIHDLDVFGASRSRSQ